MRRMRWRAGQCSCASGASIQLLPSAALLKKRAPSSSHPAPSPRWTPLLQRCTPPASASVNDSLIMHQERMKALAGSRNKVSAASCAAAHPFQRVHVRGCADYQIAAQLEASFPVRFEAPHVINARMQVLMPLNSMLLICAFIEHVIVKCWSRQGSNSHHYQCGYLRIMSMNSS